MPEASAPFSLLVTWLLSFGVAVGFLPVWIRFLRKLKVGQFLREEGPQSHAAKAQTPTIGGVSFILSTAFASLIFLWISSGHMAVGVAVLMAASLCGSIGLVDDVAKFRQKANRGISARARLLLELCLGFATGIFLYYHGTPQAIPFVKGQLTEPGAGLLLPLPIFLAFSAFLVAAAANAVNLHDGMDGLAAGTATPVFATLSLILLDAGRTDLASISAAASGGIAGFLLFNRYPARVFMGDTGSLFIGGLLACLTLAGRLETWFVPLSILYIAETLSVMVQVVVFKLTKPYTPEKPMSWWQLTWLKLTRRLPGEGKRFFRMAPLHHHFEEVGAEKGMSESKVVALFWLAQIGICLAVLVLYHLF